ncbi:hypothetical protein CfE428DRAFT_0800 [Chthoniobacter flavus Ellin428]|uniref:Uncharacterized protein n=1 Tax=Chthoniobacter flavus Ellin428 TaxID=497964 RepID=B4CVW3_9BACT|nr:hypothetical protein CfE428DRAFT_0800 [Chthoniobacter flavus Ellin428]
MPQGDLFLVIQPRLIEGPRAEVNDPLHETSLHRCLVAIIGLSIGTEKYSGEIFLCPDSLAPDVDHRLRLIGQHFTSHLQVALILLGEIRRRF